MRAVAERGFAAVLTTTEVNRTVFFRLVGDGRKFTPFMGTIAEGLVFALAA